MSKKTYSKYSAYKDSGVEWLGEIPEGWDAIRMKYLFRDVSVKNKPEEELLSVTQDKGVVPRTWVENRMVMPSGNLESFKYIRKGDFAISLRSFEGGLEFCHHDGIISPAYTVLKKKDGLVDRYYKYLFKSFSFISEIQTSVVGIREGKNISYPELSYSLLPIPKKEEQTAIANFLDDKTAKIDRAIAQKEQLISLLKERKQIIIQNAVTGKVVWNEKEQKMIPLVLSGVEGKDSGVEWIGEIPEHWKVKRLKYVVKILKRIIGYEGPPVLSITQNGIKIKDITSGEGQLAMDYSKYQIINKGEFAMNHMDLITGYVDISKYDGVISPDYRVFVPFIDEIQDEYLLGLFQVGYKSKIFYRYGQGVSQLGRWRLPADNFNEFSIPIPPKKEQSEIMDYIETQSTKIDQAISLQQTQIQKLKEYKATLIDSAVTGKIKVG
ncbi:restriction endonuclease subunit S [Algoriphagus sp.]|uniref:restriction endonuclease subunit S n=1 Tax=Algoriphagus sp. TaxID=1872435 RepID=UPI003F707857